MIGLVIRNIIIRLDNPYHTGSEDLSPFNKFTSTYLLMGSLLQLIIPLTSVDCWRSTDLQGIFNKASLASSSPDDRAWQILLLQPVKS